jgi:hypothetical protein
MAVQQFAGAYARQLQDMRRVDRTRAEQHFAPGLHGHHLLSGPDFGAGAALAAVRQIFQKQPAHLGAGPHLEVGAAVAGGAQKRLGRVPAQTRLLIDFK